MAIFLFILLRQFESSSDVHAELQGVAGPTDVSSDSDSRTRSRVARAVAQRAWQASLIAVLVFAPLGLYSMRLLWKLGQRDTPLSWTDSLRSWMAFLLSIAAILYCLAFAGLLLLAFR
jgi:hypothetical protein